MPHPPPGEVVASGDAAQLDPAIMGPVLAPPRQAGTRTGAGVAWLEALVDQPPGQLILLRPPAFVVDRDADADEHHGEIDRAEPIRIAVAGRSEEPDVGE